MEEDEMPAQGCKFPRNHNGKMESAKGGSNGGDEEEGDEEVKRGRGGGGGTGTGTGGGGGQGRGRGNIGQVDIANSGPLSRLCNWPSSRIFRVSRASGGKDRHSKVWTSKGLRDRRVRLSVPTAIQFYDLQDRLGYDQPSKAVEWLLTAAATSIAELPSISTPFPDTPQQLTDGRRSSADNEKRFDLAEVEIDGDEDENILQMQQQEANGPRSLSKSACSSTSETSKGSGLSFSRPESRIKARERARERAAGKEKEKEKEIGGIGIGSRQRRQQNLNPISQNSSFTELLTGGIHNNNNHSPSGNGHGNANESNFFQKSAREWIPSTSMDYFATGLLSPSTSRPINSTNFLGQIQLGNPLHQQFSVAGDQNQHELPHHFSFLPDHLVPVVVRGGGGGGSSSNNGDYNLNFSVTSSSSSGLVGFNRGTLQSNSSSSPSMLPHIQRFPNIDGPSAFFLSPTTPVTNASAHVTPVENHYHHFLSGFDPQLQLCYDNTNRHHDHKGKGKNSAS